MKSVLGKSDYEAHEGVNSGGANAVFWFEVLKDHGDGTVTARNFTEGAKRRIESVQVRLEKKLLLPMLRVKDVEAFRASPKMFFLFVQDPKKRHGVEPAVLQREYPLAYKWLEFQRPVLEQRSSQAVRSLMKNYAFYSVFSVGTYTLSDWKVVWPAIDSTIKAAVVSTSNGLPVIGQHIVTFIGLDDKIEAYFIAGVMNSTPFRFAVSCFSQPGSKSFGTPSILERARIPKFDTTSMLHKKIAAEAVRLSGGTAETTEPVYQKLDLLCAKLWDVNEKGLEAVQAAYRELYVSPPKEKAEEGPGDKE